MAFAKQVGLVVRDDAAGSGRLGLWGHGKDFILGTPGTLL
jgi:hypothetical protein